ncbi:conserved membrane hypothetical protein [Candidatus Magnetomoraceae bacterium gMMP-1]
MASYALSNGLDVPAEIIQEVENFQGMVDKMKKTDTMDHQMSDSIKKLMSAHKSLSHIVAPASPKTLILLDVKKVIPLIRHLMIAALVFLIFFIIFRVHLLSSINPIYIFGVTVSRMWAEEIFYLASAGLGASFSALFLANHYLVSRSFHPKYVNSYWIRFILGIISGIILTDLIPFDNSDYTLKKPLLALIGGFSADVVYRILSSLKNKLESLMINEKFKPSQNLRSFAEGHRQNLETQAHLQQQLDSHAEILKKISDKHLDDSAKKAKTEKHVSNPDHKNQTAPVKETASSEHKEMNASKSENLNPKIYI